MLRLNVLSCGNTKSVNLVETSVSFFCLYCLGLRLPFGRVEPSIGGEGLWACEAPSPPIAVSTLRPQKYGALQVENCVSTLTLGIVKGGVKNIGSRRRIVRRAGAW